MSSRLARLWQPGNPQTRCFLPDFWVRFNESPSVGHKKLPPNAAEFEVDPRMSRDDIRQYLEKIYRLPVRDVRVHNRMGKMTYDNAFNFRYRQALWKEPDSKFAMVFFSKNVSLQQKVFDHGLADRELVKQMEMLESHTNDQTHNEKFANRNRANVGRLLD